MLGAGVELSLRSLEIFSIEFSNSFTFSSCSRNMAGRLGKSIRLKTAHAISWTEIGMILKYTISQKAFFALKGKTDITWNITAIARSSESVVSHAWIWAPERIVSCVGNCLQDSQTTNTLTRNPDFLILYLLITEKDLSAPQDSKVPFYSFSCSTVSFVTVNQWFGFPKGFKVTELNFTLTTTKATNNNNTSHNFRHMLTILERMCLTCCVLPYGKALNVHGV